MKSKAKVVVIGGGAVGVSMLYHLAKKGWSDVVLVERKELTSGSTWHAAGLLPLFNMSYSVGQLHKYAVNLYKTLEKETGKSVGFSVVSNIRLAQTKDRMDEYNQYAGVAKTIGVKVNFLKPEQVKEIWPLCSIEGLVGAIQHPEDGYIQPADVTQALATGARNRGAEIYRNTVVTSIKQNKDGWVVIIKETFPVSMLFHAVEILLAKQVKWWDWIFQLFQFNINILLLSLIQKFKKEKKKVSQKWEFSEIVITHGI